jgi:hypothetical protein
MGTSILVILSIGMVVDAFCIGPLNRAVRRRHRLEVA